MKVAPLVWEMILFPDKAGPLDISIIEKALVTDSKIKVIIRAAEFLTRDSSETERRIVQALERKGDKPETIRGFVMRIRDNKVELYKFLVKELRIDPKKLREALDELRRIHADRIEGQQHYITRVEDLLETIQT